MNQKEYWDKAALKKEFTTPFQMESFKSYVSKDAIILDVGCGYGRILNALFQEGYKKNCGIDFSQKMIERGNRVYPHLDLKHCGAVFPFEDNTFDAVVLIAVLTCIVKDEKQEQLVGEIERVLKPQGILYVNDFLINQDQRNVDRYNTFKDVYNTYGVFELDEGAQLRHHTIDHLFRLTQNFKTRQFKPLVYTTMNHHVANGFYYLGKLQKT
ncbi:MAG: class I SAM-dependent methyltransferase [Proteobacteria bacterium]|nr:class I SAM-dependent methyltransferase [Pseudomonadota bacterium]MBU1581950.1 class I SAM-dependent methyltransferase [Pseudomonadota bacterium]MBU2453800.1 class I SAM-dependent methyltransferase [Pseudomonadota bacterium]MBU2627364.1 class I SAM-dependent methyltransferase [Pseudomonadota bacterium]